MTNEDVKVELEHIQQLLDQLKAKLTEAGTLCRCGATGEPEHTCPYQTEINNNDTPCHCCDKCAHECAMDI